MDISKIPIHTLVDLIKSVVRHLNKDTVTNGEENNNEKLNEIINAIFMYSTDIEEYARTDYLTRRFARRHCIDTDD